MRMLPSHFLFTAPVSLDPEKRTTWVQILATGKWVHPSYGDMAITADTLRELKTNFDAGVRDFVYADYDHGIARANGSGNAIASGAVLALELRNSDTELWAEYAPTEPAREKISKGEYRHTSADFVSSYSDKRTGKPRGAVLRGFALTNVPFIEGMQPLALGDAHGDARLFADYTRESSMKIAEKLGLASDSTETQIEAAIDKLKGDASTAIALSESQKAATGIVGEIRTALNLAETSDVAEHVRSLAEANAKMVKAGREADADALLASAIKDGKIAPAMKDEFRVQLLSEVPAVAAAARSIIEKSPKVIPINVRTASGQEASETDPEKLLDEKVVEIQKANPKLTYGKALVMAEDQLRAAAGGEK